MKPGKRRESSVGILTVPGLVEVLMVGRLLVSLVIPSLSDVLPPRNIPTDWLMRLSARSN